MDINAAFEESRTPLVAGKTPMLEDDGKKLTDLDLQHELLTQYRRAKRLVENLDGDEASINQKASGLNAVTAILGAIIRMQTDLYNAERVKLLEYALLDVLKEFPAVHKQFLKRYTEALEKLDAVQ